MADSKKIVKCEECKWAKQVKDIFFSCLTCENQKGLNRAVAINDYCSEGKKKEELGDEDDQLHVCPTCRWCLNDWHQEPCTICVHGSKWQDGR